MSYNILGSMMIDKYTLYYEKIPIYQATFTQVLLFGWIEVEKVLVNKIKEKSGRHEDIELHNVIEMLSFTICFKKSKYK